MAGKNVGWLEAYLGLNDSKFVQGLTRAQSQMKAAGNSMKQISSTMQRNITLPLTIIGGASIQMARNFEESLSKVEGLVGISREEIQGMRKDVMGLAGETGRAPQELADALFFVTSAGLRGAQAIEVLEMSAKAAAAGLGETQVVADLLTSAVNAYGPELLSASKATDVLVAAVREGKAEAPALAQSLGQILPIASNMGVSFDQIGAAVASMTRTGTNAETAAIQLRQILASLLKPAQQSEEALEKMGTSSANLRRQLREEGLVSVLGFLAEQMKINEQAMAEVFPNVRALSGALDIMGANAAENELIFQRMTDTTGTLNKAFDVASQTANFKFNQSLAELKAAAIDIGVILMPIATELLGWVKQAVQWFKNLSSSGQTLVLSFAAIAAAIGPLLGLLGSLAIVIGSITAPILAVIAAVAALGSALLWITGNWDAVVERLSDWDWWKNMLLAMLKYILDRNPFEVMIDGYNKLMDMLGKYDKVITNPFTKWREEVDASLMAAKTYEHEFTSFTDGVWAGAKKAASALSELLFPAGGAGTRYTTFDPSSKPPASGTPKPPQIQTGSTSGGADGDAPAKEASWWTTQINFAEQLTDAVQGSLSDAFMTLGVTMTDVFTGDANAGDFFKRILMVAADFAAGFGKTLISAGMAGVAFKSLLANPIAAIAAGTTLIATAGVVRNLVSQGPQGLRSGGFVTDGGVFQLHKDEFVSLPAGAAVTSQRASRNLMRGEGGSGSGMSKIALRELIIGIRAEEKRLSR